MISTSPVKTVNRREGGAVAGGREGGAFLSATVIPPTKSTFSLLLDEYKNHSRREEAGRLDALKQGSERDHVKNVDRPHNVSTGVMDTSDGQQKKQAKTTIQDTSKKEEKVSSTSDEEETAKKAEDNIGTQSDQAWVLLSSMLNQPVIAQMLQAQSSHTVSAQDSSPSSQGGEAEMSMAAGGKMGFPDAMKKAAQQSVEDDNVLASMVKMASLSEEQKGTGASLVSTGIMTTSSQPFSTVQAQLPNDAHSIVAPSSSVTQADRASLVALPGDMQISGLSVTRELSSDSSERSDAAYHQEMSVDGASYLNVTPETLYTTPSTQSAVAEQNLAKSSDTTRQNSENGAAEKSDQEGLGLATIDTARSNSVNVLQNAPSQGALSDDGGHGEHNNQDSLLASGELEQEGQAKEDNASSLGISTTFQTMINTGDAHHNGDVTAQKADKAGLATRVDEGETGTDTHSLSAALAQKQVSHSSSKLEMTVKTADAASVRVQVTRLPDGVAEVALQGADDATTKALTKSHHELLEQLNAAGIHSTSVKIEVLPAALGGMNGDQAQDHLGQDPSFGGQFGQGGGASQEEQRQNYDGVRSVLSSRDEDVGPVSGAENIVSHRRTLPAASSGSLNISV